MSEHAAPRLPKSADRIEGAMIAGGAIFSTPNQPPENSTTAKIAMACSSNLVNGKYQIRYKAWR